MINTLTACGLSEVVDHGLYHKFIKTYFLVTLHVFLHELKSLWRERDNAALSSWARELDLHPRNYKNNKDIDKVVDRLMIWIKEAVVKHI